MLRASLINELMYYYDIATYRYKELIRKTYNVIEQFIISISVLKIRSFIIIKTKLIYVSNLLL